MTTAISTVAARQTFGGSTLTAGYRPGLHMPNRRLLRDQGKVFTWYDVEEMRTDPTIAFALDILHAPIAGAKWQAKSPNANVAAFVDSQFKRVWQHDLAKVLAIFEYGTCGGEIVYRQTQERGWELDTLRDIHLADLQPVTRRGEVLGLEVKNVRGEPGEVFLPPPRYWWLAHKPRFSSPWGHGRLVNAWEPYQEKVAEKGAKDARRTWYFKNAYRGGTIRHPFGIMDLGDGVTRPCSDYARELLEKFETGGILVLPNTRDEKGDYQWVFEPPAISGELKDVREYVKDLDAEMLMALGIFPEIVRAADAGSGWSGRSVPLMVFLASLDPIVSLIFQMLDRQAIWHLVRANFGNVPYSVEPISLVPKDDGQQQSEHEPGKGQPPQPEQIQQPPQKQQTQPVQLSAAHAPAGGVVIQGQRFTGGQFIPADVLAKATPEEKAKIEGHAATPDTKTVGFNVRGAFLAGDVHGDGLVRLDRVYRNIKAHVASSIDAKQFKGLLLDLRKRGLVEMHYLNSTKDFDKDSDLKNVTPTEKNRRGDTEYLGFAMLKSGVDLATIGKAASDFLAKKGVELNKQEDEKPKLAPQPSPEPSNKPTPANNVPERVHDIANYIKAMPKDADESVVRDKLETAWWNYDTSSIAGELEKLGLKPTGNRDRDIKTIVDETIKQNKGAGAASSKWQLSATGGEGDRSPTESSNPEVDFIIDRGAAAGVAISDEIRRRVQAIVKKKFPGRKS